MLGIMCLMTPLQSKTYALLKRVPRGRVTTYKALAQGAGTRAYRSIGQFMRANPYAPQVPCHRVVFSGGSIGGFKGKTRGKAIKQKIALLQKEGVCVKGNRIVDFSSLLYRFH